MRSSRPALNLNEFKWAVDDEQMIAYSVTYILTNTQVQILDAFRSRQAEENGRYGAMLSHQRGHALVMRKKWRQLKQFLVGPRGSWALRYA